MLANMVVTTTRPRPRRARQLTFADWLRLPADGRRHELLEGEHVVTPAAKDDHQWFCSLLGARLIRAIYDAGRGKVWIAPVGVRLGP